MTDWQACQAPGSDRNRSGMLRFAAQAPVGAPALIALIQAQRFDSVTMNSEKTMAGRTSLTLTGGSMSVNEETGFVRRSATGVVKLDPDGKRGKLTLADDPEKGWYLDSIQLGPPIGPDRYQTLRADVLRVADPQKADDHIGRIEDGQIPRPFWNWFETPLDTLHEKELHSRLGKHHELAMVFTWIAGFLNILAIWDAIEGPAYGYGDEEVAQGAPA